MSNDEIMKMVRVEMKNPRLREEIWELALSFPFSLNRLGLNSSVPLVYGKIHDVLVGSKVRLLGQATNRSQERFGSSSQLAS